MAASITLAMMFSDYDLLSPRYDWLVRLLRLLSLMVFPLGALAALWSAWVVVSGRRRKLAKLWALVLAASFGIVLWVGIAFHLMGFGANY